MSIKSKVIKHRNSVYPILKTDPSSGLIVLFTSATVGAVLDGGTSTYPIGWHSKSWSKDEFTDFKGTITLNND